MDTITQKQAEEVLKCVTVQFQLTSLADVQSAIW